jgi:hypothetical protein
MWFQCVQSQDDIFCKKFGATANAAAPLIQEELNDELGGEEDIHGLLSLAYSSYELSFDEPSFDGCEATITAELKVKGVGLNPDQEGSATVKGTWDYKALLEGDFCVTDLQVTNVDIENFPDELENFFEDLLLDEIEVPDICIPLTGL